MKSNEILFTHIINLIHLFFMQKLDLETTNNSNTLHFSTDTISFDTIFASIGSITKTLKVYNHNNTSFNNINLRGPLSQFSHKYKRNCWQQSKQH